MSTAMNPLFGGQAGKSSEVSLFGGGSRGIVKQTKRELEILAARTEISAITDQARSLLANQAMQNVSSLVTTAEELMRIAPAGAPFYELIIQGYALGAADSIVRFK